MHDPKLFSELSEIVRDVAQIPLEMIITPHTRFADDLGIDSFDMVGIVFAIQDRFGIDVSEEDVLALVELSQLVSYVAKCRNSQAA
jgi:acyl carrier protein